MHDPETGLMRLITIAIVVMIANPIAVLILTMLEGIAMRLVKNAGVPSSWLPVCDSCWTIQLVMLPVYVLCSMAFPVIGSMLCSLVMVPFAIATAILTMRLIFDVRAAS